MWDCGTHVCLVSLNWLPVSTGEPRSPKAQSRNATDAVKIPLLQTVWPLFLLCFRHVLVLTMFIQFYTPILWVNIWYPKQLDGIHHQARLNLWWFGSSMNWPGYPTRNLFIWDGDFPIPVDPNCSLAKNLHCVLLFLDKSRLSHWENIPLICHWLISQ